MLENMWNCKCLCHFTFAFVIENASSMLLILLLYIFFCISNVSCGSHSAQLVDWFVSANTNVIKLQSHSTIDKKINNEKEFRRIVEALSSNIHDTNTNTNILKRNWKWQRRKKKQQRKKKSHNSWTSSESNGMWQSNI